MAESTRKCLDCGEPIKGRADKKFCSDLCRNNYNNHLNSDSVSIVRNINNALRKNRRILEELNPEGKVKTHKSKLLEKGFDFNYFTSIYKTRTGSVYHFCYDLGYIQLENDFYLLVRREESK